MVALQRQSARRSLLPRSIRAFALIAVLSPSQPLVAQEGAEVLFDRERALITVHTDEDPLDEVLYSIGDAVGISVMIHGEHADPVTIDLENVSVTAALKQLLGRRSYTMEQDPETLLPVKLWVMSPADLQAMERARRPIEPPEKETVRDLAKEVRTELQALGDGESEREILKNLGLNEEEQDELLKVLNDMEAGIVPSDEQQP